MRHDSNNRISARASGTYAIAGTTATIRLRAKQNNYRPARGRFRHKLIFQDQLIDIKGQVTCMAVDAANGRAWIGGIVTENNSEHSSFVTDIHQPGRDVWFRVLDTGKHAVEVDRTTFLGFEGGGGIITSEEYCELQIWPGPPDDEPNARTNPMEQGRIKVRPNDLNGDSDDDDDDDDFDDDDFDDVDAL